MRRDGLEPREGGKDLCDCAYRPEASEPRKGEQRTTLTEVLPCCFAVRICFATSARRSRWRWSYATDGVVFAADSA